MQGSIRPRPPSLGGKDVVGGGTGGKGADGTYCLD